MTKRMLARKDPLPSNEVLLTEASRIYVYQPDGTLVFKIDPRRPDCVTSKVIGKTVGGDDGHGYLMCMLLRQKFKVHQIVWLLKTGEFPSKPIDHINRNRRDNRIENLRLAEDIENMQNLIASTKPTAGTWKSPMSGRYCARLTHKGKKIYLGYFDTQEEANAAFVAEKKRVSAEFSPV